MSTQAERDDRLIRRRALHGWAFRDLPQAEVEQVRAFLAGGDPLAAPGWVQSAYASARKIWGPPSEADFEIARLAIANHHGGQEPERWGSRKAAYTRAVKRLAHGHALMELGVRERYDAAVRAGFGHSTAICYASRLARGDVEKVEAKLAELAAGSPGLAT
jgi:hypothetical protein